MDTLKADRYFDGPNNLERGCLAASPLVHSEACQTCSAQVAPTPHRRLVSKHLLVVLGTVALTWLVLSYGKCAFSQFPHHTDYWESDKGGRSPLLPRPSQPPPPHPPLFTPSANADDFCLDSDDWVYYDPSVPPPWAPDYPYGAEAISISLPVDSDVLYLMSQGHFQHGLVNIQQSAQITDTVQVLVRAAYLSEDFFFDNSVVCVIEKLDGERGVGIFTPSTPRIPDDVNHRIRYDITLILPAGTGGPLAVKRLETKLSNYTQNVADLQESVHFDSISLGSANGKLSVQSVTAEIGQFTSLNGGIDGHFNALSSLNLHTVNGRIAPTVNVLHRKGADPSHLSIHTAHSDIAAVVSLASDASTGGNFEVKVESQRGEVGLKFAHTPVDSVLQCRAETTSGRLEVELDGAFEGTYNLQNTLGPLVVEQIDVEDPAGKGRHRKIAQTEGKGYVKGEVKWVESNGGSSGIEGNVILKTLVAPVKLVV